MGIVVVTGASRGIGLELGRQYASMGKTVVATCRTLTDELAALQVETVEGIDIASAEAAAKLRERINGRKIDILVNNAGIFDNTLLGQIDYEDVLREFCTNALGPLRLTETLLPDMPSGAKIAMITSRMGSMADNGSGAYYAYRMSKAALNAAGVSLARDLKDRGIAVVMLHPGFVSTRMVGFHGDISPETAAERLIQRIDELTLAHSGRFLHSDGSELPW